MYDMPQKKRRNQWYYLIIIALVLFTVLAIVMPSLASKKAALSASLLPCSTADDIRAFGQNIVYYDGATIHCVNTLGKELWAFTIGEGADFYAGSTAVAAWSGKQIYLLGSDGKSTYNDMLDDTIQFARVGESYLAIVTGSEFEATLLIKDLEGNHVDSETTAFDGTLLLDCGFFGSQRDYLWTLSLDVDTTVIETVLSTFQAGKMTTGTAYLGEYIPYFVYEEDNQIKLIDTRSLRVFSQNCAENTGASRLLYGWQLIDSRRAQKGRALLLAPSGTNTMGYTVTELRLIYSGNDRRLSLPSECHGSMLSESAVYGVSPTLLYRCGINENKFTAYALPLEGSCTGFICALDGGACVIAVGSRAFCLTLP